MKRLSVLKFVWLQAVPCSSGQAQAISSPPDQTTSSDSVIQNISSLSLAGKRINQRHIKLNKQFIMLGRSLANIPPSERPKAKPSRKIDGKGAKKSQLQAALQQHSQQLAQLQQLQQLNQQLQQQVKRTLNDQI